MLLYTSDTKPQNKMKKTIFTLNIDNFQPEISKLTHPFIQNYADKIDAEFVVINQRKFPDYPMMYEKLQIYDLGKDNDWNIYIDSDCLIHPDMFDITEVLPKDIIMTYGADFLAGRFKYDNYFRRDGRNLATSNFMTIASHLCTEVWEPLNDITVEEAISNIHTTSLEKVLGHEPGYGIDDYVISRNMAKYHLKYKAFTDLLAEINKPNAEFFFHNHLVSGLKKVELIKHKIEEWGI